MFESRGGAASPFQFGGQRKPEKHRRSVNWRILLEPAPILASQGFGYGDQDKLLAETKPVHREKKPVGSVFAQSRLGILPANPCRFCSRSSIAGSHHRRQILEF